MRLLQRILALLGVAALLSLVGMTLFFAITGSPYFFASMFAMIVVPVFLYGYMIVYRNMSGRNKVSMEESDEKKPKTEEKENA